MTPNKKKLLLEMGLNQLTKEGLERVVKWEGPMLLNGGVERVVGGERHSTDQWLLVSESTPLTKVRA